MRKIPRKFTDEATGQFFGKSLAISGAYLLVADPSSGLHGGANGAVYLYQLEAGRWEEAGVLVSARPNARLDHFGRQVFGLPSGLIVGDEEGVFYQEIRSFSSWYENRYGSSPPADGSALSFDRDGNGYPDLLDYSGVSAGGGSTRISRDAAQGDHFEFSLPLDRFPMNERIEMHTSSNLSDWSPANPELMQFGPPRVWGLPKSDDSAQFFKFVFSSD